VVLIVFLHDDVRVCANEKDFLALHAGNLCDATIPFATRHYGFERKLEDGERWIVRIEKDRGRTDLDPALSSPVSFQGRMM